MTGGDDYELLFTVPPEEAARMADLAAELGLPLTAIGQMVDTPGVSVVDATGAPLTFGRTGYTHL